LKNPIRVAKAGPEKNIGQLTPAVAVDRFSWCLVAFFIWLDPPTWPGGLGG
jgi:hypothetical protein